MVNAGSFPVSVANHSPGHTDNQSDLCTIKKGRGVLVSRFSGVQGRHAMQKVRIVKRMEAEARNEETPVVRRRWYRVRTAAMRAKGWDV